VAAPDTQQRDNRTNDEAPTKRRGFMIVDMDLEDNFIQEMQNLCIASHHAMEKLKSRKKGFDIIDKWECAFCHGTIDRQSSQNVCRVSYWVLEDREKTFLDCLRLHIRTFSKNQTQALSSIFRLTANTIKEHLNSSEKLRTLRF
jgi:hypothetical protein